MRKLSLLSLTALTAVFMAGVPAMTSQAAVYTIGIPSGMMTNVMGNNGGNGGGDCNNLLGGLPGFGQNIFTSCDNPEHPNCQNGTVIFPGFPSGNGQPALPGGDLGTPSLPGGDQNQPSLPGDSSSYAAEVLSLVNAERAKAGVGALTINMSAEQAANVRAQEIQQSFSHTRPNGSSFGTALTEAGINFRSSGENIAYGQNSAQEVMQGWMNSAGHRANILNQNFTSIGIGHTETGNGVDYWTQLFFN